MLGFWDQDDENNKNSNNEINNNHNNYCHNPNNNINSQTTLIGCDTIDIILISIVISSKEAIFHEKDDNKRCGWLMLPTQKHIFDVEYLDQTICHILCHWYCPGLATKNRENMTNFICLLLLLLLLLL